MHSVSPGDYIFPPARFAGNFTILCVLYYVFNLGVVLLVTGVIGLFGLYRCVEDLSFCFLGSVSGEVLVALVVPLFVLGWGVLLRLSDFFCLGDLLCLDFLWVYALGVRGMTFSMPGTCRRCLRSWVMGYRVMGVGVNGGFTRCSGLSLSRIGKGILGG